jgi:putative transcriptional regulator
LTDDEERVDAQATASFRHQFLVAMPGLADGYFGGTVTYLCEHNAEGAMGLVINRASEMTLLELLTQLELPTPARIAGRAVLEGGPVARERGFVLHSAERRYDASLDLGPGLVLSASRQALEAIAGDTGPDKFVIALGFAGWGPGQLEQELLENAWLTCPADPAVIFDVPFEERVMRAAATLGIDFSRLSGQAGHA